MGNFWFFGTWGSHSVTPPKLAPGHGAGRLPSTLSVSECQWVIQSLPSCLPNQPSITPLSAALQQNTATCAHTHNYLSAPLSFYPDIFFIHTQARARKLHTPTRYFCFCCCLSHRIINTHTHTLSLELSTVGACCGRDIKRMEAKYPVWARAHWHNAATLFDERPAEI